MDNFKRIPEGKESRLLMSVFTAVAVLLLSVGLVYQYINTKDNDVLVEAQLVDTSTEVYKSRPYTIIVDGVTTTGYSNVFTKYNSTYECWYDGNRYEADNIITVNEPKDTIKIYI